MAQARWGVVVVAALAIGTSGCGYNTIQSQDEKVNQAQAQIQTQLQRRADLIPNLVAAVKGVAAQESTIFVSIAESRAKLSGAAKSGDIAAMAAANQQVSSDLSRLLVIAEAYPQLKSDQSFRDLQAQLEGTENRIAVARTDYNAAVNEFNATIRKFPVNLTAKIFSMDKARAYFEAESGAQAVPKVDFSK